MPIDYYKALSLDIPATSHLYTEKDAILYALGLGIGSDPQHIDKELSYVYEKDLRVFPTMAVVMAYISVRDLGLGINYSQMVHGEQSLTLHAPFKTRGVVVGKTRITEVVDRGEKGAVIYLEREIRDQETNLLLAVSSMSSFCRLDGGFGGPTTSGPAPHAIPQRPCDMTCEIATTTQQALVYRLSGDLNPLHADPAVAHKAGFERPILHGLATFGIIARALVRCAENGDADKLCSIGGRFSAPVFPGETIRVEIWEDGQTFSLRATVVERNVIVFNNGHAKFS